MWCVASHPPRSSVVGFLEPANPGSALGGLGTHDEHTPASSGESSASGQESMVVPPASRTSGATAEFVYSVHNHQATIRLARGFHNGDLVGAIRGTCDRFRGRAPPSTGPTETRPLVAA